MTGRPVMQRIKPVKKGTDGETVMKKRCAIVAQ